jgi:hypothetical protein
MGLPASPPAVTIHGLDQARAALAPGVPVTLLSAPGAGIYAGAGWWQALIAAAAPPPHTPDVLDCGNAPGRALEALRCGQRLLILHRAPHCTPAVWQDIAERAARQGAALLPTRPPSLDLADRGAARHLAGWLAGSLATGN